MRIEHVVNNNMVLALDHADRQVILVGSGLGHATRRGRPVDEERVARVFVSEDAELLSRIPSGIPPEHVRLVCAALADAGLQRLVHDDARVVPLVDHLSRALRRVESGVQTHYALISEVTHLYADEYARAQARVPAINNRSAVKPPDAEAIGVALHLGNVGFLSADPASTCRMTHLIQQLVRVVGEELGCDLDQGSVSLGRFVLHLRYLFVRIHEHQQLDQRQSLVGLAIRDVFPEAVECATRLAALVQAHLDAALTDDEVAYLALHVARLRADHPVNGAGADPPIGGPALRESRGALTYRSPGPRRRPRRMCPAVADGPEHRQEGAQ